MSELADINKLTRDFVVVKFEKEYDKEGHMILELVPSVWLIIYFDNVYNYFSEDHDQGMRRLNRALKRNAKIDSTDGDAVKSYEPEILSNSAASKLLKKKTLLRTISERLEEEPLSDERPIQKKTTCVNSSLVSFPPLARRKRDSSTEADTALSEGSP
ncbi:PREDICTED: uncharacterized protein LOC105557608 [Vollenhovia emeryi]|uniref:uncharacterized protein LOC105557608 n=1 Tax=Vollenhovia emeryi TaxID=411798 RepID=UPI0005F456EC|nr:PREDICTED: uncharacterized protein LOC105557608 [Vollenhovia emeryi]